MILPRMVRAISVSSALEGMDCGYIDCAARLKFFKARDFGPG